MKSKEERRGYEDCLKISDGPVFYGPIWESGGTGADQVERDSRETDGDSMKNFLTLRAALVGSELPIPGSMQFEAGEPLGKIL